MRILLLLLVLLLPAGRGVEAAALLKPGDPFPAWTMRDQTGVKVSSSDLAGKTYLLWFYPKAMTPGCTAEGRGLRDELEGFRARGVEILGVSFDDPVTNAAFVKVEGFPFRLLSDETHRLAASTGAADSTDAPVARRISYLVGPDGKVERVYDSVNPASHGKDVLGDLARH
jgi:thioredoxin-dependent peroxiredoxin